MREFLRGKKTYLMSGALALYAVLGFVTGQMEAGKAFELLTESGALAALRAGLSNG